MGMQASGARSTIVRVSMLFAATLMLAACGGGGDPDPGSPSSETVTGTSSETSTTGVSSPAPASSGTSGSDEDTDHDEHVEQSADAPVWDDAAKSSARKLAKDAITAFARPDRPQDEWWKDFSRYLEGDALELYRDTDAARITDTTVEKTGKAVQDGSPSLSKVEVTTDANRLEVYLHRNDGAAWLVYRIDQAD